jgi:hypothetical protein
MGVYTWSWRENAWAVDLRRSQKITLKRLWASKVCVQGGGMKKKVMFLKHRVGGVKLGLCRNLFYLE